MPEQLVQISLHDIAPIHLDRMRRALPLLRVWGVKKMTWLWVPDFHRKGASHTHTEFVAFCKEEHGIEIEWALHGYYHLDVSTIDVGNSLRDRIRRKYMTGGEGEFLSIDAEQQRTRLEQGIEAFHQAFGEVPTGFVAPAWLYQPEFPKILREAEIRWTENHHGIMDISKNQFLHAPVITWATRKWYLKYGSLVVCPAIYARNNSAPLVRIAMHPHDFDHSVTVKSIAALVQKATTKRKQVSIMDVLSQ